MDGTRGSDDAEKRRDRRLANLRRLRRAAPTLRALEIDCHHRRTEATLRKIAALAASAPPDEALHAADHGAGGASVATGPLLTPLQVLAVATTRDQDVARRQS